MRVSKKLTVLMLGWFSFFYFLCSPVLATMQVAPQWAKSVTAGSNASVLNSITVDAIGNVYAAGYIYGTGTYDFGSGVTVSGTYASGNNVVVVKYDSSGSTQWAKSITAGSSYSGFNSITVDATGNLYAAGYMGETGTYNFGNGVTVAGTSAGDNVVLVKYDSSGTAQWAKSVTAGSNDSGFNSITVDTTGNLYAAGYIYETGTCNFGNGVTVAGTYTGSNVVLVKYDSSGTAQWAKSVTAGSSSSVFNSVTVDATGNLYAVGYIDGIGTYNFGNGVAVVGTYASGNNVVLIKYDSSGSAQWVKSITAGSNNSGFNSITIDATGNLYVAGYIDGIGTYNFGSGVTVAGAASSRNIVLVKYDSSGIAQWAKSVTAGSNNSGFNSITVEATGNLYAVGCMGETGTYNFGSGVTAAGTYASGNNVVLVKYDSSGIAQWAKSVTAGSSTSAFISVAIDATGDLYAAGFIDGAGTYNFGNGVTVAGRSSNNVLLVKYSDQPPTITNVLKSGYENAPINFAASDFINSFTGYLGNSLAKIKLISLPTIGALKVSGTAGAVNQEIPVGNISSLSYIPNTGYIGSDNFIWNGSDGTLYATNAASVNLTCYAGCGAISVGASYGGGTVFCVSNTTDTSQCVTTGTGYYGLFMANQDQVNYNSNSNHGVAWSSVDSTIRGANSTSNGAANTATIIAALPNDNSNNNAAWVCRNYIGGGYTDWYLPSQNELNNIYLYAKANNLIGSNCTSSKTGGVQCLVGGGNYCGDYSGVNCEDYWSSTECPGLDGSYALHECFVDGGEGCWDKYLYYGVRAVRAFNHSSIQPVNNVTDINKSGSENGEIGFTIADFSGNFNGACGSTNLAKIKIISLPSHGTLKLSGSSVAVNDEILIGDLVSLTYTPNTGYIGSDSFGWNGSDGNLYAANAASVSITIYVGCGAISVGATYGGGTVFCVSDTTDTSKCVTTGTGYYGLFMANQDQVNYNSFNNSYNNGVTWSSVYYITGANSTSNGAANTATIIAAMPGDNPGNNAAWVCHSYTGGGYTDWYLPSINELVNMYLYAKANNLIRSNCTGSKTGGVQCLVGGGHYCSGNCEHYWSSTEYPGGSGYLYRAYNEGICCGIRDDADKANSYGARAVRAFNHSSIQPFNDLTNINKSGSENSDIKFTIADFISNFSNTCGNGLAKVKIISLPSHGTLKLSGNSVATNDEISINNLNNLTYTPGTGYIGSDSFSWNGSDGSIYATNSSYVVITINGISSSKSSSVLSSVATLVGSSSELSSASSNVLSSVVSSSETSSVPSSVIPSVVSSSELSSVLSNVISSVVSSPESSSVPSNVVSSVVSSSESSNVPSSVVPSVGSSSGLSSVPSNIVSSSVLPSVSSNVIPSVVSSSKSSSVPSNVVSSVVSSSETSNVPSSVIPSVTSSSGLSSVPSNVISSVVSSPESSSVPSNVDSLKGSNVGAIVGGVVGVTVGAAVISACVAGGIHYYNHHVRPLFGKSVELGETSLPREIGRM